MLVHEMLSNTATKFPDKTVVLSGSEQISYQNLQRSSQKIASYILEVGAKPKDRVLIFMDTSISTVISIYGVLFSGCAFIIVANSIKAKKLKYIIQDSSAKIIIADENKKQTVEKAITGNKKFITTIWCNTDKDKNGLETKLTAREKVCFFEEILSLNTSNKIDVEVRDTNLASIIYTSGSTGYPKGVMCPHKNCVFMIKTITSIFENSADDVILNLLPLSFDYGLYQVLMCVYFGGTIILEKGLIFPKRTIELLSKHKVTAFPIVPTIAAQLLNIGIEKKYTNLNNVRYISNTGAALSTKHIEKLKNIFPASQIFSMYGLTECKRVSYLPPKLISIKPNSVGVPVPGTRVKIVDRFDKEVPIGSIGELVVIGPSIMEGYWRDPKGTKKIFKTDKLSGEKILYTGDFFKRDKEGFLYFVSRKDEIIKTRGERVSPKEIENTICEIENVIEVLVTGIPDDVFGKLIKAYVVVKNPQTFNPKIIMQYCAENLENCMVPKYVAICKFLPKNENQKIDKKKITECEEKYLYY